MPAQILITHDQAEVIAEQEAACIIHEMPAALGPEGTRPVEVWVLDGQAAWDQHRTIIVSAEGEVLSDLVQED